jgi:hypothetical protein
MAGIALAVTVIVVALAWVNRDQSPRPGAPSRRPADAQRRVGASDDDRSTL